MAKYESMEHFRSYLADMNKVQNFSDSKVDDIILALADGAKKSSEIKKIIGNQQIWDGLYVCIIDKFVDTEFRKSSHRDYWLTPEGYGYLKFITETTPISIEDEDSEPLLDEEDSSETEDQQVEPASQSDVIRDIGATLLSDDNRQQVIGLQQYYQTLLLGDEINRSESMFLVSIEEDHAIIQIFGHVTERVQMLEVIKQIATQKKEQ